MIRPVVSTATHIGCREENEDCVACVVLNAKSVNPCTVVALADGVGGSDGGADAARAAVDAVIREAKRLRRRLLRPSTGRYREVLQVMLSSAVNAVYALPRGDWSRGPATTLVIAICWSDRFIVQSVGDSRAVLLVPGSTYAHELVPPHAFFRNILHSHAPRRVDWTDTFERVLSQDEISSWYRMDGSAPPALVISSDGVTFKPDELLKLIEWGDERRSTEQPHPGDAQAIVDAQIAFGNLRQDNTTAAVVRWLKGA